MERSENQAARRPTRHNWMKALFCWQFFPHILGILIVLLLAAAVTLGAKNILSADGKTTALGFEDIGELATQSAYCTEVEVTEASRELFGMSIPFTQSKYIYSYDVTIKAGIDFGGIDWDLDEEQKTIRVTMPETRVLSSEINLDSFKVYHESESIFRHITLEENNAALQELQHSAEETAIANGLLENARSNAETILKGFFTKAYDLDKYTLTFE